MGIFLEGLLTTAALLLRLIFLRYDAMAFHLEVMI